MRFNKKIAALAIIAGIGLYGNSQSENSIFKKVASSDSINNVSQRIRSFNSSKDSSLESRLMSNYDNLSTEEQNLLIASYVASHEGRVPRVYCAQNPSQLDRSKFLEPTIGVGHYMDRGDSRETFERVLPNVNYDDVYLGTRDLTENEIDLLFADDLTAHMNRAQHLFPDFDSYSVTLKKALVDGTYRGCLSGSPETIRLINSGEFEAASKEYLNHDEYKNAKALGRAGIIPRMNSNSARMLQEANRE